MKENKDYDVQNSQIAKESWLQFNLREAREEFSVKRILKDFFAGFIVGMAFIIPGFSGGSMAAILGIYERMVGAVAELFRRLGRSVVILVPMVLGVISGAAAMMYPLTWAIEKFPIPTISLFVGFAIGGLPTVTDRIKGKPTVNNIISFAIPYIISMALIFIPNAQDIDLINIGFFGYVLLFMVCAFGSVALVVPGISGSMILLIFGYYNPILNVISDDLFGGANISKAIPIVCTCGIGIAVGFFFVSMLMRALLKKYPRSTYFAIVGFIIGSLPSVYVSTMKDVGMLASNMRVVWLPESVWHWIISLLLLAVGVVGATFITRLAKKLESRVDNKSTGRAKK